MNTVTIKFRAKLDHFAGGMGYKVPKLTHSHVSVSERDTLGVLFMGALDNADVTRSRLKTYADLRLPGVVFPDDNPDGWTITPRGNGFMADVSITRTLERKAVSA